MQDYREVDGRYDAIVSVEMVEAVGVHRLSTFFRVLDDRLGRGRPHRAAGHPRGPGPDGGHGPVVDLDAEVHHPRRADPSERAIAAAVDRTSLRVVDRLRFGDSYARTLEAWRRRFARTDVERLGFDHTFRRMWDFYLAQSEAGFRTGDLDVTQMVLRRAG